jgi:opacity protein-like surface antigen
MNTMKGYALLALLLTFSTWIYGQKGYEIGAFAGISNYIGDINPDFSLKTPGPHLAFVGRYNFNSRTSLRMDMGLGRLVGKDEISENPFQQARNLSFRTDYIDASLGFEFNFFNLVHGSRDQFYTPYVFAGLGFTYFNPKAELDDTWYALRDLGTEGQRQGDEYSRISGGLTYGIGLKMDFSYEWSFNAELCVRQPGTDYLDDVSTVYPELTQLAATRGEIAVRLADRSGELGIEPIGTPGRQRGNSGDNDSYYSVRIGVAYYIGLLQCPSLSRPQTR